MNIAKVGASATKSYSKLEHISRTAITCSNLDTLLSQCLNLKLFNQTLCQLMCSGIIKDTYAASRILSFSTESPSVPIDYSKKIFTSIENPNGFIWNTMMRAYVRVKRPHDSISMYKLMLKNSFLCIDNYTHPILIHGCSVGFLNSEGSEVHDHAVKMGFGSDVYVVNNLINMYCISGHVDDARKVFDESSQLDLISWNSMLAGYVQWGNVDEALLFYARMPDRNVISSNSMIVLLGKSGKVGEACQLFNQLDEKDLVSWTALISCYEQNSMYKEAVNLFLIMSRNGIRFDEVVIVTILSACSNLSTLEIGETVHCLVLKAGFDSYVNLQNALIHMYSTCGYVLAAQKLFDFGCFLDLISWNSMISGYIKCGLVEKARELFDYMPEKDVISWSTIISGYAQSGKFSETLALFRHMLHEGIKPDETTLVSVVSACTHLAALDQGKWLDAYIRENGLKMNSILGTSLVDMYMKCGCMENAMEIFYGMEEKGVSSWNAVILGLSANGSVEKSLHMFEEMKKCKVAPNEITFMAILGACRHMGLVEEGREFFRRMTKEHGIEPNIKHYGCLVDLLGRNGLLKEAKEVIENMPMSPDVATWGALLGACKMHGDREMGEEVGRRLIELEPEHDGFHVLLSNIYASKGNWSNAMEVRHIMARQGVVKTTGWSIVGAAG